LICQLVTDRLISVKSMEMLRGSLQTRGGSGRWEWEVGGGEVGAEDTKAVLLEYFIVFIGVIIGKIVHVLIK
jgi:hypothetical protein